MPYREAPLIAHFMLKETGMGVMAKEDLDKAFDTELSDDRVASSFVGWSKFEFVFE